MTEINIQYYKANDLIMAEYNPRQLTKDQYTQLKDSLTRFGLVDPLIVNKHKTRKNILVGGHQRLRIAKEMGLDNIPCVEVDLPYDKERELNIRLNKNVGEWDYDSLANHFDVGELTEWGFSDDELQFWTDEPTEGLIEDDDIPEVEEAITKQGDLWMLGDHKVLCGDATKKEDVERLMDGQKADMVFTDPPYALFGNSTGVAGITDDKMVRPFFRDIFNMCRNNVKLYSHIYVCCDWHSAFSLEGVAKEQKLTPKNLCIWDKGDGGVGAMYQQCYEMVWFFANSPIFNKTTGGKKIGNGERTVNGKPNIWRFNRANKNRKHTAQKPVEMMANAINNSSDIGGTCIDPFLGSGSTLIACTKTNRKCYGMEIDPHYCDVIVKRWEEYTGNKAERIEAASA